MKIILHWGTMMNLSNSNNDLYRNCINVTTRKILLPVNDLIEGTSVSRNLNFLSKSQWWSPRQLQRYQDLRLRMLINHAYSNVQYYNKMFKSLGLKPSDIKGVSDLKKLPILTKDEIRKNPESFLATNTPPKSLICGATSGSSGNVFEYYIDKNVRSISRATGLRGWEFAGYKVGDKIVTIAGSSLIPKNISFHTKIRFGLSRNLPISSYGLNSERIPSIIKEIQHFNPRFIRGYPSSISLLAKYVLNHNDKPIGLSGVMTTAETLSQSQREIISSAFNCEVFDQFGCFDGGANANECNHHCGYHISMERSVHEFTDNSGTPVAPGENGSIILTDLWNYAMPLIRYDAGDMGRPIDELCSCGRGLPLIRQITGRTIEQIVLSDEVCIPGLLLTDIFEHDCIASAVHDYQIIQEKINKFTINIVKSEHFSPMIWYEIEKYIKGHLGNEADISYNFLDTIPRTIANKRRIVISKVRPRNDT